MTDPDSQIGGLWRFEAEGEALAAAYRRGAPFPHLVLDDFLDPEECRALLAEDFADFGSARWTYQRHYNQKTYSCVDAETYGPTARRLLAALGSPRFTALLDRLTGLRGLFLDAGLEDAGLVATPAGGFLNVHNDLTVHPAHATWLRRVNLILYLNPTWPPSYRGDLELWDTRMTGCVRRIAPRFNRCVLFQVGPGSLHGLPEAVACPPDTQRRCLILYYYTAEAAPPPVTYGRFHARPGDGRRAALMALDSALVGLYERLRGPLRLDDRLVNRVMRYVTRDRATRLRR